MKLRVCNILIIFLIVSEEVCGQQPCAPVSGRPHCTCRTSNGIIDLTSIANYDGTPRYTGLSDTNDYTYSYNPCYGFGIGNSGCSSKTAACQNEKDGSDVQYSCANSDTETFIYNPDGDNTLEYDGGENGRVTVVTLHCDETATIPRVTTTGDTEHYYNYKFDLYSICACPGKCTYKPPPKSSKSSGVGAGEAGIVLIFLFLGAVISYFVIGVLIMKFKFEKTGLDLIPQKEFWTSLPFLVKDGCIFTVTPIIRLVKRSDYKPV